MAEYSRKWEDNNQDKRAKRRADPQYKKYMLDYQNERYANDPEYRENRKEADKRSYQKHAEKRRAKTLKYAKNNPGYYSHKARERRGVEKSATPAWADMDAISRIYEARPVGYHVDHIIPLQGDTVCGLHVDYNLQYLTPKENMAKGNKLLT